MSLSSPGGFSLKQMHTLGLPCPPAVASDKLALSWWTFLFSFVEKKRFCFSYILLGGNNCVFRYWWSDPMTDNPLATDIADWMCFNVVLNFMVSFVGALWINCLNSAIWWSAYVLRSASCLLSWSCLSCWIILDNSSHHCHWWSLAGQLCTRKF